MDPKEIQPKRRRWLSGRLAVLLGVLCALLVLYFVFPYGEILFDREALQKYRVEKEYARLDKERSELTVDKSSPVYHIAKVLGSEKDIIQCDGTPSVNVGGQRGYRILYRYVNANNYSNKSKNVIPTVSYDEYVLFLTAPQSISAVKMCLKREQYPASKQTEYFYLGEGDGYFWFSNGHLWHVAWRQNNFHLKNGEDLMPAWILALKSAKDSRERSRYLHGMGRFFGERAIPYLMRIVETPKAPDDRSDIAKSLTWIPGEQATKALLEIYDKYGRTANVPYALTCLSNRKPREGAKRIYLDLLSSDSYYYDAVKASLEFHWGEAVSLIKAKMASPYTAGQYTFSAKAVRALEGNPIPDSVSKIEDAIYSKLSGDEERFGLVRELLKNEDSEAVMFVGIDMATANSKMRGGYFHKFGEEILRNLPKSLVLPVLEHLAESVRDEMGLPERPKELLELVRNSQ